MKKSGLCILFNHPFPQQLPTLRAIYKYRFSRILFLIPFHQADDADVFTVYRGAFQFDGMVVEARNKIEEFFSDCDYVTFVHNDCLLNPEINELSIATHLGLTEANPFNAQCKKLEGAMDDWVWLYRLPYKILHPMDVLLGSGSEKAKDYLPEIKTIKDQCARAGFDPSSSKIRHPNKNGQRAYFDAFITTEMFRVNHPPETGIDLGYPLLCGYSDLFSVPMGGFSKWVHLLGLLSSLDLFEEISVPTALVWTFGSISTADSLNLARTELWGSGRKQADDMAWSVAQLLKSTYFHPMKLNKLSSEDYHKLLNTYSNSV